MKITSAPSGNPRIIHMKMRPTLELGFSTAPCSTAANLKTPVQDPQTTPSLTVDTAPASLIPSNAAHAQLAVSGTPASPTATGGVSTTTTQQLPVSLERAPPPRTMSCREPHVHDLLLRLKRKNAVDNVRTSPQVLELLHVSSVLWRTLTHPVKMSVEQLVGIVEDPYWRSGGSVPHLTSAQLP